MPNSANLLINLRNPAIVAHFVLPDGCCRLAAYARVAFVCKGSGNGCFYSSLHEADNLSHAPLSAMQALQHVLPYRTHCRSKCWHASSVCASRCVAEALIVAPLGLNAS